MIELLFSDSAAGAMKQAKHLKPGDCLAPIGRTMGGNHETAEPRIFSGILIGGTTRDVVSLQLGLDIGDISDMDIGMNARKKLHNVLLASWHGSDAMVDNGYWDDIQVSFVRLQQAKATLEPIRIWVCSGNPAEVCGLYFTCHFMAGAEKPLSVVRVPELLEHEGRISQYRGTGAISPEEYGALLEYEEPISDLLRREYAKRWSDLVHENAQLRTVINGSLISVPEDFFDFVLREKKLNDEIKIGQLIVEAMNRIPVHGDAWWFMRIQAMLQAGEFVEVSTEGIDHPYSAIIKRSGCCM